jgi:arginase
MALRTILGEGPAAFRHFVRVPVRPENVTLLGARSIDPGERTCIEAKRIRTISPADMARSPSEMLPDEQLGQGPIFVHVDYDVLDPLHHPHTAFPEPDGLSIDVLIAWLNTIRRRANVVGWGLTEFAPVASDSSSEDVERLLSEGFGLSVNWPHRVQMRLPHGCPERSRLSPAQFFSYFLSDFVVAPEMVTESPRCYGHKPVKRAPWPARIGNFNPD